MSRVTNFNQVNADNFVGPVNQSLQTFSVFVSGAQTVGANKSRVLIPFAGTVTDIRARLATAPAGSSFIVDVHKNGTTLFSTQGNRPTIAAGANASSTTLPAVTAIVAGDELQVDVDQIGSGTAGSDLTLAITVRRA